MFWVEEAKTTSKKLCTVAILRSLTLLYTHLHYRCRQIWADSTKVVKENECNNKVVDHSD